MFRSAPSKDLAAVPAAVHEDVAWPKFASSSPSRRGPRAPTFKLTRKERRDLKTLLRRRRTTHEVGQRALTILALADEKDSCVSEVAESLGHDRKYVRKWRDRFVGEGVKGLKSQKRRGRPIKIDAVSRCKVISMACAKPDAFGVAYRNRWTMDALTEAYAREAARESFSPMSRSSIIRTLNGADLRPHRIKMWLHSPDPKFKEKVTNICELYLAPPADALVLCIDEKTGLQALGRKHPLRAPAPGREARMDYEYVRNGTRKLLACWNVQTGEVYGEMRPNRKACDLVEFMEEVARRHPGRQIHIIWDNLNIHYDGKDERWTKFNQRHQGRFHFHYTPIHASWVNQIELWFGILQRRIIEGGVFNSLEELDEAVVGFIEHWNEHERKPFKWSFTGYPLQTGLAAA